MRARTVVCLVQLLAVVAVVVDGCGPGRGAGRGRGPRKLTPLVFKQHVPNVSENTLTASGLSEGRIDRNENDTRFKDLVLNYNEDIIFKDEEGTGADRLMTQRCNEKLNTLAISVMNQWPGVHLRVTEGWDEDGHHATNSLHYEGRAVDITTSDRDRSKYGMLARLAVEAGFDWVYYESRAHIHCSVKSESSQAAKYGGCFTSTSTVRTSTGDTRPLSELRIGERILTHDPATNKLAYSEVLAFLDYDPLERREFFRIHLRSGRTITVTPNHLLLTPTTEGVVFARDLSNGDRLLVADDATGSVQHDVVASMDAVVKTGVFAPLTATGTVVVDGIVASCYATVDSQELAHWAYGPFRVLDNLRRGFGRLWSVAVSPVQSWGSEERVERTATRGVHWYAKVLYTMAEVIIPQRLVVV